MRVVFATSALKDYRDFECGGRCFASSLSNHTVEQKDSKVFNRINRLLKNIEETPFKGLGKPEPLKHNWTGYWSRRITQEHRLVYKVTEDQIFVAQCKFHY